MTGQFFGWCAVSGQDLGAVSHDLAPQHTQRGDIHAASELSQQSRRVLPHPGTRACWVHVPLGKGNLLRP